MTPWEMIERFCSMTLNISVETAQRYFIFTTLTWLLFYVVLRSRWFHRKIVDRFPAVTDIGREVLYSAVSLLMFGVVGTATVLAAFRGWTLIYRDRTDYAWTWFGSSDNGWTWFVLSIVLTIFVHDAYFYWTHRLMHHRRLFRMMHLAHHRSTNPTPFAAYAFSPWEALVQAGIFPLAAFTIPIHYLAFAIFMIWQITFNVLGHSGYEIFPRRFLATPLGKFLNTPTHHIQHHQSVRTNFALYFNIWDRLMGTNDRKYEERFAEVTSRVRGGGSETEIAEKTGTRREAGQFAPLQKSG